MAEGYRGNAQLKVAGTKENVTKEEFQRRLQEIIKCKNDPVYFANNYFQIISLERGLHTITLFPRQEEMLRFFVNNDRCICTCSRQFSKSTTYIIFCLWFTIFYPEKRVLLAANKLETALELMGRLELAYEKLPNWLKPGLVTLNKGEIVFENRSGIKGFATSSSAARGHSANICILDEFAFTPPNVADSFFTSIYPVISSAPNTKFIIVSTPNGVGNLFHNIWQQALENKRLHENDSDKINGWLPFMAMWWDRPGRDEAWKAQQIASIGMERFRQEFCNEFISSTYKKLIPDDKIDHLRMQQALFKKNKFPEEKLIIQGQSAEYLVKIWYPFDPQKTYLASADVADGVGKDSSVLYIWDITDYTNPKQAAAFSSNSITIVDFAYVCFKVLQRYYNPTFIGESNAIGKSFFDQLIHTYQYDNFVILDKHGRPGVHSHVSIKGKACLWLQEYITTNEFDIEIHDENLIDDMENFVKKESNSSRNLTYAALNGAHDDHIMTLVWAIYALNPEIIQNYYQTVGNITTSLGKVFPKEIYPLVAYDDIKVDTSNTNLNALKLAEQWADYLNRKTESEIDNASDDYKDLIIENGSKLYKKEERPESNLEKMVKERKAALRKPIEEHSLISYGDPHGFRDDRDDRRMVAIIDDGWDAWGDPGYNQGVFGGW